MDYSKELVRRTNQAGSFSAVAFFQEIFCARFSSAFCDSFRIKCEHFETLELERICINLQGFYLMVYKHREEVSFADESGSSFPKV